MCGPRLVLSLALAATTLPAAATLGEDLASIHADQMRVAAVRRQQALPAMQVHTLTLHDGSSIRQYTNAAGRVFAVSWNTHFKPRLDQLLGTHFDAYAEAGRQAQRLRAGVVHGARLQSGDLVVESTAHLNGHVGRAWLRSQLPPGTDSDALR